jgi:hypothetical protein
VEGWEFSLKQEAAQRGEVLGFKPADGGRALETICITLDWTFIRRRSALREGRRQLCAPGMQDWLKPARTGRVGQIASSTPDDGPESNDLHRLDLRLPDFRMRRS